MSSTEMALLTALTGAATVALAEWLVRLGAHGFEVLTVALGAR